MRAIAAMAENRVIGNGRSMPWKIPEELAFFRRITDNATVLMGRKTFESIGYPLPGRRNIVVSSDPLWCDKCGMWDKGVVAVQNFRQLLGLDIGGTIWVCGGATVYYQLLPACRELYLTTVFGEFAGDVKFPKFDSLFAQDGILLVRPEFRVERYVNRKLLRTKNANSQEN
ncbi:MAG: dihydrofolate reductase [Puniceicoccales bacterium]|nr:dihydrofolate reductase [Puniceicoccales bacterium]